MPKNPFGGNKSNCGYACFVKQLIPYYQTKDVNKHYKKVWNTKAYLSSVCISINKKFVKCDINYGYINIRIRQ